MSHCQLHTLLLARAASMSDVVERGKTDLAVGANKTGHVLDHSQHGHVHLVAETGGHMAARITTRCGAVSGCNDQRHVRAAYVTARMLLAVLLT